MTAAEMDAMDEMESTIGVRSVGGPSTTAPSTTGASIPADHRPAEERKKKLTITYDKYMEMRSLIVLHLSEVERETRKGMDREELIDWYLEMKEEDMGDLEQLEYEKELVTKVLKRLVKVRPQFSDVHYSDIF